MQSNFPDLSLSALAAIVDHGDLFVITPLRGSCHAAGKGLGGMWTLVGLSLSIHIGELWGPVLRNTAEQLTTHNISGGRRREKYYLKIIMFVDH